MGNAFLVGQSKEMGDMLLQLDRVTHIPLTLAASAGTVDFAHPTGYGLRIENSDTADVTITSTSKIDLTRFSVLRYWVVPALFTTRLGFATTNAFSTTAEDYAVSINAEGGGGENNHGTLDVSALNGEYYLKFCLASLVPHTPADKGVNFLVLEV